MNLAHVWPHVAGHLSLDDPDYSDSVAFDAWHRGLRGAGPVHERSRTLKSGFQPLRLAAYHMPDAAALAAARERHEFT
jgi:hypothetical protein